MILWDEKFKYGFALEHFFLQVGLTPCVEVEAIVSHSLIFFSEEGLSMLTKT